MSRTSVSRSVFEITVDALMAQHEDDIGGALASVLGEQVGAETIDVDMADADIAIVIEALHEAAQLVVEDPSDYSHEADAYAAAAAQWERAQASGSD